MKTVYLIRHGMTEANEKRLYCGRTDLPLSKKGREGLIRLKDTVVYPETDTLVASGLRRSAETASILYGREPDIIMRELNEMDFGEFEMKGYEDLKGDPEYQRWITGDGSEACPKGESRDSFGKRAAAGYERIMASEASSAAVICHGGTIVCIMDKLFEGIKNFYEWQPDFGRGYRLDLTVGGAPQWHTL